MRKRKLFIQITCGILALLLILSLVSAVIGSNRAYAATSASIQAEIDSLNSQKSSIQTRMGEIQAEIDSLDYEKANVLEKKRILDEKNTLAQQELDVIQEQIDIIDGLVSNMQLDLEDARAEEEYQRERFLTRVRAMEEDSALSYIQVVFDATSFSDMLTRLDLVNEVMNYDEELEADYIAARENVEVLEQQAEELYITNEDNKAELEEKKIQLESDIEAATQLILEMENDIEQYNLVLEEERETQASVEALIVQKETELAEAKAAEEAARKAAEEAARKAAEEAARRAAAAAAAQAASQRVSSQQTTQTVKEEPAPQTTDTGEREETSTNDTDDPEDSSDTEDPDDTEDSYDSEDSYDTEDSSDTEDPDDTEDAYDSAYEDAYDEYYDEYYDDYYDDYSSSSNSSSGTWMMWPSYTSYLTSSYGYRVNPVSGVYKLHSGCDIGASYGTNIYAAASGTVILAGWNGGYGNCVMINHGNGYTTLYGHMSSIAVYDGQYVSMGDTIGYVGSTGNSTGPHLHFEVRDSSGGTMDPMGFSYY